MRKAGEEMHRLITRLYPICRSITGNGLRETLQIIREHIPIDLHEVPSGMRVFDWTIPPEWNVRDAWVKNAAGERLIDFKESNLHVVSYSAPVRARLRFSELRPHLFTAPANPEWIPYRTTYYKEDWGFCLSENRLRRFREGEEYEVLIDSSLEPGHLTYGELCLPGQQSEEVLISSHVCHPSLANDNLSGIAVAVELARHLATRSRRYSYRFLFPPGTIGAIAWLARNQQILPLIRHGLVLSCVGDLAPLTYKRTRQGDAEIDRIVEYVLSQSGEPHMVIGFAPDGYDERQYNSPGINLPVGCLMRSRNAQFPEYHTSADNLEFVCSGKLEETLFKCLSIIDLLEANRVYWNRNPNCEPQLSRRGVWPDAAQNEKRLALLWVLNLSDGRHALLDIATRSGLPFSLIKEAAARLAEVDLLSPQ